MDSDAFISTCCCIIYQKTEVFFIRNITKKPLVLDKQSP